MTEAGIDRFLRTIGWDQHPADDNGAGRNWRDLRPPRFLNERLAAAGAICLDSRFLPVRDCPCG